MARQSATEHLNLLVTAGLVTVVRRGRTRLHYLDPTPIHELQERWISAFDQPRLDALSAIKQRAEEHSMSDDTIPTYVYVTYIRATIDHVWQALTDADVTAAYWAHRNVSDWLPGSTWEHQRLDGSGSDVDGRVLSADPPRQLVITFEDPGSDRLDQPSVVTFDLEQGGELVRLTVTHEHLPTVGMYGGISRGWPAVLASLKSLLETGSPLPSELWDLTPAEQS